MQQGLKKTLKEERHFALRLMRSTVRSVGWRYGAFCLATVAFAAITLLPAQIFRYFTENAQNFQTATAVSFISELAVFGLIVATAMLFSSFGSAWFGEWLRLNLEAKLRQKVMRRLHQLPLTRFDSAQRGEWLSRMTADLQECEDFLTESIPGQVRHLVILVGSGTLFFYYSGNLAWLSLGTAALLAWVSIVVQKKLTPVLRELRSMHANVFQQLIESLEGIRTIRSYAVERYIHARFENKLKQITTAGMRVVRYYGALIASTQWVTQAMITLILVVSTLALQRSQLTLHDVLVYPFFIGLFYNAAQGLASSTYQWNRFFVEAGRLGRLLYEKDTKDTSRHFPISLNSSETAQRLEVKHLSFGYGGKKLMDPFDFQIEKGETIAVTGHSGCGKSTFLEVLAGLRPALSANVCVRAASGEILWQEHSGLRLSLPLGIAAYVEQRPYIFEASIRENLRFGGEDTHQDLDLEKAIESVGLGRFLNEVGGLGYRLVDRGQNLSEGQRYRLALARALLLRRPFLLLDEPFAALDKKSANAVTATLNTMRRSRGILLVTHMLPEKLLVSSELSFEEPSLKSAPIAKPKQLEGLQIEVSH